jgi:hypothetical protein
MSALSLVALKGGSGMTVYKTKKNGLKLLVNECRKQFRIPENENHYSEDDFLAAEKQFVKLCLRQGINRITERD